MHSAGQKAAVSSTVSDFLQHILWWPRWARYGAPVLLLGLTQEHSCLAHLLILFYLTEKCFCFCNQGFWGVWGTLGCPRQGGFSPPKQARQHPTRQEWLPPQEGRHLLCRSITCTSVPFSKTASSGRSRSSLPFFCLSPSCPLSFLI